MQKLTLKDLSLGLNDLMSARLDTFKTTRTFVFYEPNLQEKLNAINALPSALIEDRPFAALLGEIDERHDGLGGALYCLTEAIARHPTISPELKASAEGIRKQFVPRLAVLKDAYADEAHAAHQNRLALTSFETALKNIPTPDKSTAYAWVTAFIDEGDKLNKVLSDRATVKAGAVSEAAALRGSTIGLLGRVRTALADELSVNPSLPRNLEALLFGYFDILNKFREQAGSAAAEPPPPPSQGETPT